MRLLLLLLIFPPILSEAQSVPEMKKRIAHIKSEEDANNFLEKNEDVTGHVLTYDSAEVLFEYLDAFDIGEVMTLEPYKNLAEIDLYKILDKRKIQSFQVQYIYLDPRKLSMTQIDSLRKLIIKKHAAGESFDNLVQHYTMDNNPNGGLLRWQEGEMVKEFEQGIKQHSLGEVFTVDVPDENWYYVVKNIKRPQMEEVITVLFIELQK